MRWLRYSSKATLTLAASVFVVALAISRDASSATAAALFGASVGGAMGSLEYRHRLIIPAASRLGSGLWLLSGAWGTPLLVAALYLGPTLSRPDSPLATVATALALSAGMSLVSLVPLHWLQGHWGRKRAP